MGEWNRMRSIFPFARRELVTQGMWVRLIPRTLMSSAQRAGVEGNKLAISSNAGAASGKRTTSRSTKMLASK